MRLFGTAGALTLVLLIVAVGCGAEDDTSEKEDGTGKGGRPSTSESENSVAQGTSQSISGMDAEATLVTLQKPGLECWQAVEERVLYACSGDEDENMLYEATIMGSSVDSVSGMEVRVSWRGSGDFDVASQPFLGFLSTQLKYHGSDEHRAFEFVNRNLSSGRASATIGAAEWTVTTSVDSKTLALAPAP